MTRFLLSYRWDGRTTDTRLPFAVETVPIEEVGQVIRIGPGPKSDGGTELETEFALYAPNTRTPLGRLVVLGTHMAEFIVLEKRKPFQKTETLANYIKAADSLTNLARAIRTNPNCWTLPHYIDSYVADARNALQAVLNFAWLLTNPEKGKDDGQETEGRDGGG